MHRRGITHVLRAAYEDFVPLKIMVEILNLVQIATSFLQVFFLAPLESIISGLSTWLSPLKDRFLDQVLIFLPSLKILSQQV